MSNYGKQPWMDLRITNAWDSTTADGDGTHTGTDFAAGQGTKVTSPVKGTVKFIYNGTDASGITATFGWRVRVQDAFGQQHGFAHMHTIDVKVGDVVQVGTSLGQSGGAKTDPVYKRGVATGAHIHWGVYSGDTWTLGVSQDPVKYLAARIAAEPPPAPLLPTQREAGKDGVNARKTPDRSQPEVVAAGIPANGRGDFIGWESGEVVEGNGTWFVGANGYRYWSGGFKDTGTHDLKNYNKVGVVFDAKEGTPVPTSQVVYVGDKATLPDPAPELEGFAFEGWLDEAGELFDFSTSVNKPVKLTAAWKRDIGGASAEEVLAILLPEFDKLNEKLDLLLDRKPPVYRPES